MHRFFAENENDRIVLRAEDAQHALRVLRLSEGDEIEIVLDGERFRAEIQDCTDGKVFVSAGDSLVNTEPSVSVTLYQGLPKADKMEWIVQKCTELGVSRIQPVLMQRCIMHSDEKAAARKMERLCKIAGEAVKQCGRIRSPEIGIPKVLAKLETEMNSLDLLLVPWEEEEPGCGGMRGLLEELKKQNPEKNLKIGIVIGPEGGICADEVEWLRNMKARTVSLGPRILRTETAAITSVALALAYCGEME